MQQSLSMAMAKSIRLFALSRCNYVTIKCPDQTAGACLLLNAEMKAFLPNMTHFLREAELSSS